MLDVMVDLETTGTLPDRNAIIQVAAVQFNLLTGEVFAENMFNRCMMMPPHRSWDEGTREWWARQDENVYASIMSRAEFHKEVISDLVDWARPAGSLRFWSKPSHFDFNFLASYFHDEGYANPFEFRQANDMNSWIRSRYFPDAPPEVPFTMDGSAHDALFDVLHQIKVLMWHYKNTKQQILMPA
jgi:oligoribonuclease (3'-5' exoribonuclease)